MGKDVVPRGKGSVMLWRGDDGSLMWETPAWEYLQFGEFKWKPIALTHYMSDGRVVLYAPEPLCLPRPEKVTECRQQ
jgi:hypothetical protein